ncbi:MAG: hypothetical protein LUQ65_12100 [Candidatus Helarchaeota archaeon]|nr:hypothetical protein [Candidatus Helarchaeota archaeon]
MAKNEINLDDEIHKKVEKVRSEERKKKFQTVIYLIGLISVLVLFTSLYRGQMMNDQVTAFSQDLTEKQSVRDEILDMQREYDRAYYNLWAVDYEVAAKVNASMMSLTEANITITSYLWSMLVAANNYYDTFVAPVLEETAEEEKYAWLFEEGIITEWWVVPPVWEYIVPGTLIVNDTEEQEDLDYNCTFELMQEVFTWGPIYVEVDTAVLDAYIYEQVVSPMDVAKNQVFQIQLSTSLLTIGILAMSFLVDFSAIGRKWKYVYVVIGLACVGIAMYFAFFL